GSMSDLHPPSYPHTNLTVFGDRPFETIGYAGADAVILPIPLDRTTSYVQGTRFAPREILAASSQLETWDEELEFDLEEVGIHTLPEMELPSEDLEAVATEIRTVATHVFSADKFLIGVGGEHSITPALVAAAARHSSPLHVLQIDAHADLRDTYLGSRLNHACAMRRVLETCASTQVGIRSLSREEAQVAPTLQTRLFFDTRMRRDENWIADVVDGLGDHVYVTIDCDGLDLALMPAVGTPEPGGLTWPELTSLLRSVFSARRVVGCDIVELCPIPGLVAHPFLCAKLILKILAYRFARRDQRAPPEGV
ncbi:MAG: agmatinase, partial [Vicinamibacterales bacterium]|nr:agmatinase [Vicinamibacterales bacterium]